MAAVAPRKRQCELGSYYPAGTLVEAATAPSRWDVVRHFGSRSAIVKRKNKVNKVESSVQLDKLEKMESYKKIVRMVQRNFIDSWLLPCSLRSHRTANPRPKMGFAIFRLCPPTTLQDGESIKLKSND
jgi:hypothetical protein